MGDIIHNIVQYADAIILIMPLEIESIDITFDIFEEFQKISRFKVNFDKTEIFPLGTIKYTAIPLYTKTKIKWSYKSINALGIHIIHDKNVLMSNNYNPIINKIENTIRI